MWYRITDFFADHRAGTAIAAVTVVVVAGIVFAFTSGLAGSDAPTTTVAEVTTTEGPATSIPTRTAEEVAADETAPPECRAAAAAAAAGVQATPDMRGKARVDANRELYRAFHQACAEQLA